MNDVFAHGTLQLSEAMFAVTGRNLTGRTAGLENYVMREEFYGLLLGEDWIR